MLCFSKYWYPLLQGFLCVSSVTWHSAYPRNPETASSMLVCLCILRNFIYGLTSVTLRHKLTFKCLTEQRIDWTPASLPVALPFFFFLFPIPMTQLVHNSRTSVVLMTSLGLAKIIHSYDSLTHWHRGLCIHDVCVELNCFSCRLNPVDGAAVWHCIFVLSSMVWCPRAPGSYWQKCDYYLLVSTGRRESSAPRDALMKLYLLSLPALVCSR